MTLKLPLIIFLFSLGIFCNNLDFPYVQLEENFLKLAHAQRDNSYTVGVKPGDWIKVSIKSDIDLFENISFIHFTVKEVNSDEGIVKFDTIATHTNGFEEKGTMESNIFTGEGDLQWILIPSMLNENDILSNSIIVSKISSMNLNRGEIEREVVILGYPEEVLPINAIYDRETGFVVKHEIISPSASYVLETIESNQPVVIPEFQEIAMMVLASSIVLAIVIIRKFSKFENS